MSVGFSGYLCSILDDIDAGCPTLIKSAPFARDSLSGDWFLTGSICNVPALAIVVTLTLVSICGVKESARVTGALVVIKLSVILLFIFCGVPFVNTDNWSPFFISADTVTVASDGYGVWGLFKGASVVFFSYIGYG